LIGKKMVIVLTVAAALALGGCREVDQVLEQKTVVVTPTPRAEETVTPTPGVTLDKVIEGYLKARGGKAKLAAVESVRMTGTMTGMRGVTNAPITLEKQRSGGRLLRKLVTGDITTLQGVDGGQVWEVSPATGVPRPRVMAEKPGRRYRHLADMDGPLVDYAKKGHTVQLLGKVKLPAGEAYKVKVLQKDGDLSFLYLDAGSFRLVEQVDETESGGYQVEAVTTFSDFRTAGGLLWPFSESTSIQVAKYKQEVAWKRIEVDVPLPGSDFRMPAS
jgi:hypothetical protein